MLTYKKKLFTCHEDGEIFIWNLTKNTLIRRIDIAGSAQLDSLNFDPKSKMLFCRSRKGQIYVLDIKDNNQNLIWTVQSIKGNGKHLFDIATESKMLFLVSDKHSIEFKDYANQYSSGQMGGGVIYVAVKVFEQIKTGLGLTLSGNLNIWNTLSKNVLTVGSVLSSVTRADRRTWNRKHRVDNF